MSAKKLPIKDVMAVTEDISLQHIFDFAHLRSQYQPIVDLTHGDVVGAEALARWPELGVTPDVAFDFARREGRVSELDALCQRAAIAGALDGALPEGFRVFVNVEPGQPVDPLIEASTGLDVIAEITERALMRRPAELLRTIDQMRAKGCGIALDDVGAVPDSLALMPFVAPDVIKLDISLVQSRPNREQASILTAVSAYAERSGATILAEGIESREHYDQALALGATLGQGWYFGRPGPLTARGPLRRTIPLLDSPRDVPVTPFDLINSADVRIGTKGLLLAISRHIEQAGVGLQTPPVVLAAFQDVGHFTPASAARYTELARNCPAVVALGVGLAPEPAPGVRGATLRPDDRLRDEWTVAVVGSHYTGALIAKDLGDSGPDHERRFAFVLTHDQDTVIAAARILLRRIEPMEQTL